MRHPLTAEGFLPSHLLLLLPVEVRARGEFEMQPLPPRRGHVYDVQIVKVIFDFEKFLC